MKSWENVQITRDSGEIKPAIAPLIISASRSTDIPAFHAEWLVNRLKRGYVSWINPFNRTNPQYISFQEARLFVFWTKNPKPMIQHLPFLDQLGLHYYFQYSLNNYEKEGFEPNVPSLASRIDTFIRLSEMIGKEKVIWRFDPLLLTDQLTVSELLTRIWELGNQLVSHTDKLVFSFADILSYQKVQINLIRETSIFNKSNIQHAEFSDSQKHDFAAGIQKILKKWLKINPVFRIATCAEDIDLEKYQITHNKCIDDELIAKLFPNDKKLMDLLGVKPKEQLIFGEEAQLKMTNLKDKGQRKACGCIISKDIGSYNTCNHLCVYCYANASPAVVRKNLQVLSSDSESILQVPKQYPKNYFQGITAIGCRIRVKRFSIAFISAIENHGTPKGKNTMSIPLKKKAAPKCGTAFLRSKINILFFLLRGIPLLGHLFKPCRKL